MKTYTMSDIKLIKANLHLSDKEIGKLFGVGATSIKNARARHNIRKGKGAGFFKKGLIPWNKGKHYNAGGRSVETQFKKGGPRPRERALGTVYSIKEKDGSEYLFIKLAENRTYPYGRYVWEQATGDKVQKSEMIIFKDGNPLNCEFSNLDKITRADNARRNINREKAANTMRKVWAVVKTYEDYGIQSTVYKFKSKRKSA